MRLDAPQDPCSPVCSFDSADVGGDVYVCEVCGSLWRFQEVTQVDQVTFLPIHREMSWARW